jgi:hypothetical protein
MIKEAKLRKMQLSSEVDEKMLQLAEEQRLLAIKQQLADKQQYIADLQIREYEERMNFPLTNVFPHEVYQPCDSDK